MNVEEILKRVKRQFGDEQGLQITDEDIIRWINDGQRELAVQNDLMQTTATTPLIKDQDQYYLPPDILLLRSVRIAGRRLEPVSIEQASSVIPNLGNGAVGVPTHFTVFANKIDLHPTPNYADPNDLQLYYTRTPIPVEAHTSVPELPLQYHNRLVDYCLQKAYELDENWDAARIKGQQLAEGVSELRGKDTVQDYYPSITSTDLGWVEHW